MSSPVAVGTIGRVQCVAFAVRLLSGQAGAVRAALASCWSGARKEAYQDARRRAPGGHHQGSSLDPARAGRGCGRGLPGGRRPGRRVHGPGSSAEPFDCWFRGHAGQVHGIALDDGFTEPELVLDYGTSRI
jgi:hypothetical protein